MEPTTTARDTLLEAKKVTKTFPGTTALDEIDFELRRGEVHAIVGENGAGKSTLMKILSGAYSMTSGEIFIEAAKVHIDGVGGAQKLGIFMLYQELTNVPKLSVAENIFLGMLPKRVFGIVDFPRLFGMTNECFRKYDLDIDPKAQLQNLSVAEKQFVEIMKVINAKSAKIIIMDEPTSSLTKDETGKLFNIIRELKRNGASIIYISHRLDEVLEITDRVSVFRDGKNRGTLSRDELDEEKIIALMLGHSLMKAEAEVDRASIPRTKVVFEVRNLNIRRKISDFGMKLFEGEILGIAGLMGSGKDELVKSLFGLWPAQTKQVYHDGERIKIRDPRDALKRGIVYLPEERKLTSLFLELSVKYNISPIWLFNVQKRFIFSRRQEDELSRSSISMMNIRTPSPLEEIVNLSGGNQQKTVFSRLLALGPRLMILNDPTRGIDVGSREEIYRIIKELTRTRGTSVIVVSSEISELCYLADRVIVLSRGETCGEFIDGDVTLKNVLTCAVRAKVRPAESARSTASPVDG
jgi:ABC-type sugar transport system ATPase subunit